MPGSRQNGPFKYLTKKKRHNFLAVLVVKLNHLQASVVVENRLLSSL
jgi:hypothetical protein